MLSFSVSSWDLIKFPYFAERERERDTHTHTHTHTRYNHNNSDNLLGVVTKSYPRLIICCYVHANKQALLVKRLLLLYVLYVIFFCIWLASKLKASLDIILQSDQFTSSQLWEEKWSIEGRKIWHGGSSTNSNWEGQNMMQEMSKYNLRSLVAIIIFKFLISITSSLESRQLFYFPYTHIYISYNFPWIFVVVVNQF